MKKHKTFAFSVLWLMIIALRKGLGMINKPIVLILGAGASWDYGFPTGQLLKAKIWEILSDGEFGNMCSSLSPLDHFKRSLELTPDLSIDAFLEHNFDDFGEIGKKAIARVLLPFENNKSLFKGWMQRELVLDAGSSRCVDEMSSQIPKMGQHWYTHLFNLMSNGVKFDDFNNNKLTVVTFNYDRSFEWFMLQALSAKYQKTLEESAEVLRVIPIIHIYGKLGKLRHLDTSLNDDYVGYDSWSNVDSIERRLMINHAAESIKIIHEPDYDLMNLKKSQEAFIEAQRIYFLGFGFHKMNMERLFNKIKSNGNESLKQFNLNMLKEIGGKCFGTAFDVSIRLKRQMGEFGLEHMRRDLLEKVRNHEKPERFSDSTIFDFFKHNIYAEL